MQILSCRFQIDRRIFEKTRSLVKNSRVQKMETDMRIRNILRSALNHPFIVFIIFSLLIIYKHLPTLFNILTTSFPIIFFTAIFLGIILINGEPNLQQPTNPRNPINTTKAILTKPEPYGPDESYSNSDSTSESEISPTLDEIHPLLSDSESESDKETEKKDETEKEERKVVAWTADDTKTLQQIGTLELERNTHLENLIAKRKAVRKIIERDLIDLEGFDSTQFQIQPVIAPKMNPFDLPCEEEIPGSAPSVLLPITRNPFDFPFDQPEESETENHVNPTFDANGGNDGNVNSGGMSSNNNDFRRNEKLFRRHESFTIGAPVQYRFKPFFMPEKMDLEEESEVERESSEKSSSLERETPSNRDDVSSESHESSCEGGEMMDDESNDLENNENYNNNSSSSEGDNENLEGENEKTEDNEDLDGKNEKTMVLGSHHEDSEREEVYDDTESNVEQLGKEEEPIVDCHVADPVYDSSPTAHEKPPILVEALFNDGNSETEVDSREIDLPSPPKEKQTSNEEPVWAAPSLKSVDEIESRSRELSEIREHDIIGAQISEIHEDLKRPITPIVRGLHH